MIERWLSSPACLEDNIVWYYETGSRPDALVRFDLKTEIFQSLPIPWGGGHAGIAWHMGPAPRRHRRDPPQPRQPHHPGDAEPRRDRVGGPIPGGRGETFLLTGLWRLTSTSDIAYPEICASWLKSWDPIGRPQYVGSAHPPKTKAT
jgi:hypothetical protein